jgi:uncharacterized membrane protein YtjA (UPF0391 family)
MGSLLYFAVVFLVVAIVAAFFGFGVAGTAVGAAKLLFWGAIVFFVIFLIAGLMRRA